MMQFVPFHRPPGSQWISSDPQQFFCWCMSKKVHGASLDQERETIWCALLPPSSTSFYSQTTPISFPELLQSPQNCPQPIPTATLPLQFSLGGCWWARGPSGHLPSSSGAPGNGALFCAATPGLMTDGEMHSHRPRIRLG